jgi:hypothetical protein
MLLHTVGKEAQQMASTATVGIQTVTGVGKGQRSVLWLTAGHQTPTAPQFSEARTKNLWRYEQCKLLGRYSDQHHDVCSKATKAPAWPEIARNTKVLCAHKLHRLRIALKALISAQIQLTAYTCLHAATCGVTYCTQNPVCVVAECLYRRFGATYRLPCSRATGSLNIGTCQPNGVTCRKACNTAVANCSDCPDEIRKNIREGNWTGPFDGAWKCTFWRKCYIWHLHVYFLTLQAGQVRPAALQPAIHRGGVQLYTNASWNPSGHYSYHKVSHSQLLRSAHTVCLCPLCGSENKQRLFPYTALTDWFL